MIPSPHIKPKPEPEKPRERWSKAKGDTPVVCIKSGPEQVPPTPQYIQNMVYTLESNKGKAATIKIYRERTGIFVEFPVHIGPQHIMMARKGQILNVKLL